MFLTVAEETIPTYSLQYSSTNKHVALTSAKSFCKDEKPGKGVKPDKLHCKNVQDDDQGEDGNSQSEAAKLEQQPIDAPATPEATGAPDAQEAPAAPDVTEAMEAQPTTESDVSPPPVEPTILQDGAQIDSQMDR
jgi:hypothetical protein